MAASAGYDVRLVDRLGPVDVADDNPTARAFATAELVTANARDGHPAAAAVPLTSPGGVCGVLAAEFVAGDLAGQVASIAAARVVAAQLAMLVAPAADAPADVQRQAQGLP